MNSGARVRKGLVKLSDHVDEDDIVDRRSQDLRQFAIEDSMSIRAVKDVFAGTNLVEDAEKVRFVLELRGEVRRHWGAARDSFLAIGRALVAAESRLSKLEYERLRAGMDRLFPFGDAVASQLRKVARAVDDKRIPEDACPGSYATAYQIAVLKPNELQMAIDRGLVREDVTRKEIVSFRKEIQRNSARANWNPTETERDRLKAREQALVEELENIRMRLKVVDQELERS
jgi:hypothetical protein